jgi:GPH family glycoside/pentoside/hexuronide:cation symporter
MVALFSSFSVLSILFYSQGVAKAASLTGQGHVRLATWRETGGLVGVCFAAVLPAIFSAFDFIEPMTGFAISFGIVALIATTLMAKEWRAVSLPKTNLAAILKDSILRRLLAIALLNAAPVAVTASLFLFFVEFRLGSEGASGPLLLLFFLSAAISVPFWGLLAKRFTVRKILILAMALSIVTFGFALGLGTGDIFLFAIICAASGAALGADMTLLPAAFSRRIAQIGVSGGQAFGLWSFCAKFTLALAAALVLPALDWVGFSTTQPNTENALWALTLLYAGLPCILKLGAMAILSTTHLPEV